MGTPLYLLSIIYTCVLIENSVAQGSTSRPIYPHYVDDCFVVGNNEQQHLLDLMINMGLNCLVRI